MKTAIYTKIWASGGMVDTHVLGTCPVMGEGSSPFSPTRNGSRDSLVQKRVYQFLSCQIR